MAIGGRITRELGAELSRRDGGYFAVGDLPCRSQFSDSGGSENIGGFFPDEIGRGKAGIHVGVDQQISVS